MNKEQLKKALQAPYDTILFGKEVLKTIFPNFQQRQQTVAVEQEPTQSEQKVIDAVGIYGAISLDDGTEVTCYEILLQPQVRIEQSRVNIQQYVRKLLHTGEAALVNFVSPTEKNLWRFTLVAKDSQWTDEGIKETVTHAKRYTYIVDRNSHNRTLIDNLADFEKKHITGEQTLENLIKAFSVEALSKAFFAEYQEHYQNFVQHLTGSRVVKEKGKWVEKKVSEAAPAFQDLFRCNNKNARDFVKKLLGRIVFLYFVQRKGWMGASTTNYTDGDTDFMLRLFHEANAGERFFADWLTKLFFDTLNNHHGREEDNFTMPDGASVKIPFLNGGLFDRDANDHDKLLLPPELFHNPEQEDTPNKRGFLDFLNSYNFTVYEDSPDDHTVAVDPEMLGHIFENLLEDNKDKGAFYTPKEIVHYMCQESLLEYLRTNLQGFQKLEGLEAMIKQKQNTLTNEELQQVQQAIAKVKICDPAIGSGAFPMGLLQEIFALQELIANELHQDFDRAKAKEQIIQNSIYGVDIERGAVDIARLRFWLSLVVDEEKPKPLPNLDYKIMQGNSLLESFEGIDLSNVAKKVDKHEEAFERDLFGNIKAEKNKTFQKSVDTEELQRLLGKYYAENSHDEKNKLRNQIEELVYAHIEYNIDIKSNDLKHKIADGLKAKKSQEKLGKQLSKKAQKQLDEMQKELIGLDNKAIKAKESRQKREKNYFLWHLMFKDVFDKGGFDIVIGNPPFVQIQRLGAEAQEKIEHEQYQVYVKTGDLYTLFFELGHRILNENGRLNFISSNKWLRANYGQNLRGFLATETTPIRIIDFGAIQVFDTAGVDSSILMFGKTHTESTTFSVLMDASFNPKHQSISSFVNENQTQIDELSENEWLIFDKDIHWIKNRIEELGNKLFNWNINIYRGILTGYNEAFVISDEQKEQFVQEDPKSAEILKPVLRGKDIEKWSLDNTEQWLINSHNGYKSNKETVAPINIDEYPAIKNYLFTNHWEQIEKRQDKGITPYNLRNCAYANEFEKEKIMYIELMRKPKGDRSNFPKFMYDEDVHFYGLNTTYIITGQSLKYILATLNSKLGVFMFPLYLYSLDTNGFRFFKNFFENIPIKRIPPEEEQYFEMIVDYILFCKKQKLDTPLRLLERVLDEMVIDLYFEKEMRNADFYILDRVKESISAFNNDDTDEFKANYIHKLESFIREDHSLQHRLKYGKTNPILNTIYKSIE